MRSGAEIVFPQIRSQIRYLAGEDQLGHVIWSTSRELSFVPRIIVMPGWKRSSKKSSYKKKSSWKKRKTPRGYRRKAVHYRAKPRRSIKRKFAAKRRGVGAKKKPTVKAMVVPEELRAPMAASLGASYGASTNGVGSWSRARTKLPFADRFFCRNQYSHQLNDYNFSAPGVSGLLSFRANSVWDPQWTTGIAQPTVNWFLTIGEIYLRYRVHASSIKIMFDAGTLPLGVWVFGIWPSLLDPAGQAIAGPNNLAQLRLIPNVHLMQMVVGGNGSGSIDYQRPRAIKHYMKIKDLAGVQDIADDTNFSGFTSNTRYDQAGGDPALVLYWHCTGFNTNGDGDSRPEAAGPNMGVEIEYDVEYFNLVSVDDQNFSKKPDVDGFEHMKI